MSVQDVGREAPAAAATEPAARFGRRDLLLVGLMLLVTVFGYATLPFTGALLQRPLLYVGLRASTVALVEGGAFARAGREPVLLIGLLAVVRLAYADVLWFLAGRRWGDRAIAKLSVRRARSIERAERMIKRFGLWALVFEYYLPFPPTVVYVSMGASGVGLVPFLLCDLAGTVLWVASIVGLGWLVGHPAVGVVERLSADGLWLGALAVALAVLTALVAWQLGRRPTRSPSTGLPLAHVVPMQRQTELEVATEVAPLV